MKSNTAFILVASEFFKTSVKMQREKFSQPPHLSALLQYQFEKFFPTFQTYQSKIWKCKEKLFDLNTNYGVINFSSLWHFSCRSYLRNGENFVQFIGYQNKFTSIEGSYTLRTSDRRYHTIVYEIPLDDFDYVGMAVKGIKGFFYCIIHDF